MGNDALLNQLRFAHSRFFNFLVKNLARLGRNARGNLDFRHNFFDNKKCVLSTLYRNLSDNSLYIKFFFLSCMTFLSDNRGMTTRDTKKTRLSVRLSTQAAALLAAYERSLAGRSRRKVNRSWVIDRMIVAHFGKKEGAK